MGRKKTPKERKLASRRRKVSLGRVIRVSDAVYDLLNASRGKLSWDCIMRRTLGLPDRYGTHCRLIEGMLEPTSGMLILRLNGVSWEELEQVVQRLTLLSQYRRPTMRGDVVPASLRPVRMREIP